MKGLDIPILPSLAPNQKDTYFLDLMPYNLLKKFPKFGKKYFWNVYCTTAQFWKARGSEDLIKP